MTELKESGTAITAATQTIRQALLTLPRRRKQAAMIGADVFGYIGAVATATWLTAPGVTYSGILLLSAVAVSLALPTAWLFGLYTSIIRYMGVDLYVAGFKTVAGTTLGLTLVAAIAGMVPSPLRLGIAFATLALLYVVGGRVIARMFLNRSNRNREQVIIYGAGDGGARLTAALFGGDEYLPVALIDDNEALHGKRIHGLEVFPPSRIQSLIDTTHATGVLLAMPSVPRRRRRRILEQLAEYPVHVRTIPGVDDLVAGKARVDDISEVDVEDLLGRNPVPPNPDLLRKTISGKSVMVTGAGGSIGAELCRQIIEQKPKRLVLFEMSEAALYTVNKATCRLRRRLEIDCEIVALLGSVHHEDRIREALRLFDVDTVYHAAAYKHVPIVEHNIFEGIHNNAFGTLHTARAAADVGVETFVLISTDKAVNPTNVMGATKRLAELVLQAMDATTSGTRFCMVRFGNVLESSGSVVPLFREQIRSGGPVTVTHRDIIRYFMTIPEAAQLVIQAGSMARGGDVFVLDMGKPVRIEDLARRMIALMGLTVRDDENPDGDIEIHYIGLRPAEKLYEELLIGSNVTGTEHRRILRADEDALTYEELTALMDEMKTASDQLDYDRARAILMQGVKEYSPSNGIDDLLWSQRTGTDGGGAGKTVVDFPRRDGSQPTN